MTGEANIETIYFADVRKERAPGRLLLPAADNCTTGALGLLHRHRLLILLRRAWDLCKTHDTSKVTKTYMVETGVSGVAKLFSRFATA